MHELMLGSKRLVKLLVWFYNFEIQVVLYLKLQLNILDATIEKGKVPALVKLKVTWLIEADLKLIVRVFTGLRNNQNI